MKSDNWADIANKLLPGKSYTGRHDDDYDCEETIINIEKHGLYLTRCVVYAMASDGKTVDEKNGKRFYNIWSDYGLIDETYYDNLNEAVLDLAKYKQALDTIFDVKPEIKVTGSVGTFIE